MEVIEITTDMELLKYAQQYLDLIQDEDSSHELKEHIGEIDLIERKFLLERLIPMLESKIADSNNSVSTNNTK